MASPSLEEGRVTRERYWQLVEDGVIGPDDRVELLDGVIVAMSPQNPPHAYAVARLSRWLHAVVGNEGFVRVRMPLDVSAASIPEPDLAVIAGRIEDAATGHPTTALLIVEVAESSVAQDRLTKGPMYAAAGIPEYWLVNLREHCVEVHRQPVRAERRYVETRIARADDVLDVAALPDSSISVHEILPPLPSTRSR
ncbi:MAG: Uma2 family endonuclease [Candidatus Binatia bacterium]